MDRAAVSYTEDAGSIPAGGIMLKKVDEDEYRTDCGTYSVIRNRGMTGVWEKNKHGWLVYKDKTYLAWVQSLPGARKLLRVLGVEV